MPLQLVNIRPPGRSRNQGANKQQQHKNKINIIKLTLMPDNNKALGKKFSVYFNLIQYFAIPTTSEVIIANILKQTIVFRLPCLVAQKKFKIARKPLLLYWLYSALVKYF